MALASAAPARSAESAAPPTEVPGVTVVAATPLAGAVIDLDQAPYAVESLSAADLAREGQPGAARALAARAGAVNVNDNLDDPFQPDILYRGFAASPVLGTPQGLAVYQDGVRVNEAFGDAVNWDLIPDLAIAHLDVVGSNPVYGLNALGGAVAATMKNGFDDPGGALEVSGGSFGRRSGALTWGGHSDRFGAFVAARAVNDEGWRRFSASSLRQIYADVGYRDERWRVDLSYTGADNRLRGESAAPVQELAVDRSLVFTSPQLNHNRLDFVTGSAAFQAGPTLSLQARLYYRGLRQGVLNGDASGYASCAPPALAGLLCQADATTPLAAAGGGPVPDLSAGGGLPIGQTDREDLAADTIGFAVQAVSTARVLGRDNQFAIGLTRDRARTRFRSSVEPGPISTDLVVQPSGFFVVTPEGTPFTATPVDLDAQSTYDGVYLTDTFQPAPGVSLTASGRYNVARLALNDRLGAALSGRSVYRRFNPAFGATWRIGPALTAYLGYAEGARAPTPSEIECSDPSRPCLLPSSLSADPPNLRQVVSRTLEAGLRGKHSLGRGRLTYSLGVYRTRVRDDIYAVSTSLSAGYFQNIPGSSRRGGELEIAYRDQRISAWLSYAHVDAVFESDVALPSPSHPFADAAGAIQVRRRDRLPGIPRDRLKAGLDFQVSPRLLAGLSFEAVGSQVYRGDESNQLQPLPGYAVLGLHGRYALSDRLELFMHVQNALDARYATFGLLGDPTGVGAPGVPAGGAGVDSRFQSPAAPVAVYAGLRISL